MSEIDARVEVLRRELEQVKDHPLEAFRARAKAIETEIAEWEAPEAPTAPAPSEEIPEPVTEPVVETAEDVSAPKATK